MSKKEQKPGAVGGRGKQRQPRKKKVVQQSAAVPVK